MEWPMWITMIFAGGSVFGGLAIMLSFALSKKYLPNESAEDADSSH